MILYDDGWIVAAASDDRRAAATDPLKSRATPQEMKPVPDAAIWAVSDTFREQGIDGDDESAIFLQAKIASDVLKAHERRLRLQQMKSELIDRRHATALVFRLAREERDA